MSELIIIEDSQEEEESYFNRLTKNLPLEVKALHIFTAQHNEPILFLVESRSSNNKTRQFAWFPPRNIDLIKNVLNLFYATLSEPTELENHIALTECFIRLLSINTTIDVAKEAAKQLLSECFGTYQLGTIKRVIRPLEQDKKREIGDVAFYLLPPKLQCYTVLGK